VNTRDNEKKEEVKCWIQHGDCKRAKRLCEGLLKRCIQSNGKRHPETAALQHLLGRILFGIGQPKEAIPYFKQAIAVYVKIGEQGDVERSGCLIDLFKARQAIEPSGEDIWGVLTEACNIRKNLLMPDDPAIAEILHLVSMQNTDEMEEDNERPAATRAIMTAQHMFGTGYLACLAVEGLVSAYRESLVSTARTTADGVLRADATGNVKIWLAEWLVEKYANLFGAHNQRLLEPLAQLAELYEARDRIEQAVAVLELAKSINEHLGNFTGEEHQDYLESLARLYERGEDWPKLIGVLKKQLAIVEQDVDNDISCQIAELADKLGKAHLKSGDYPGAFAWCKRAATFSPDNGENDGEVAATYRLHLGNAYEAQGDQGHPASYRKALCIYRNALKLGRQWLGPQDTLVAEILGTMGNLLTKMEEYGEAVNCHQQAAKIWRVEAGNDDPAVADSLNDMAAAYVCDGKYREARKLARKAVPIVEKAYGVAHENIVPFLNNAALAYAGCKEYQRAIEHLERAVQIVENSHGAWSSTLTTYIANLGKVYVMANRQGDAKMAFERAVVIAVEKLGVDDPETKSLQANLADVGVGKMSYSAADMWQMTSYVV
jgi:tetratricopeptide (TPR) repeat protein